MTVGAKRLALVLGCLGALAHLVFMVVYTQFLSEMDHTLSVWTKVVLVTAACFLIPFGLVCGIAWVISGFRAHSKNQAPAAPSHTVKPAGPPDGSDPQ